MPQETDDAGAMAARYARRNDVAARYLPQRPEVVAMLRERQNAFASMLHARSWGDVSTRRAVEVGCGDGGNLAHLLRLGFDPAHLIGIDLLPDRVAMARAGLPAAVTLAQGDASQHLLPDASQDLVLQFTVFSSLLQPTSRQRLADAMWRWLKPGGAIVSYDFCVPSPGNRDVRALTLNQLRGLFAQGRMSDVRKVTLAPPLARVLAGVHPRLPGLANALPWLRTHRLVWIEKPA